MRAACLGVALVLAAAVARADTLVPDAEHARRWLQPDAFADLPPDSRDAVAARLAARDTVDPASCDNLLVPTAELRPSTAAAFCLYLDFELQALGQRSLPDDQLLDRLAQARFGNDAQRWQDYMAITAGWRRRLAGVGGRGGGVLAQHPASRAWQAVQELDRGNTQGARDIVLTLPDARCPTQCALVALFEFVRGRVAFHDARRLEALSHARRARVSLRKAQRREAVLVPLLAPDVAVLLYDLSDGEAAHSLLEMAQEVAQARLPAPHAANRHLGATRFALLSNDGQSADAAALYDALVAHHGALLRAYPFTDAQLALGEGVQGYLRADYANGIMAAQRAQQILAAAFGDRAPLIGEALNIMGVCESARDQSDRAVERHREALALRQSVFSGDNPLVSESHNNLSVVFHNMGRYDLAETFITRSLEGDRRFYGNDHEEIASALSNLAAVYRSMGEPGRAIALLREAVEINTRLLGNTRRRTAIMHHGLGQAYLESGEYAAAFDSFSTSIAIHQKVDPGSRNIPIARHNLAKAAVALERFELARELLNNVLIRYDDIYGERNRNIASAYRDLALAERGLGNAQAADDHLMQAMAILATTDALEVRWRVLYSLAQQETSVERNDSAVFFGKLALEVLQRLRATQGALSSRLQRAFARQRADSYRDVAMWLAGASRLLEAQRVLDMLRDEEFYDFTRRQRMASIATVPFTAREDALRQRLLEVEQRVRDGADTQLYRDAVASVRAQLGKSNADIGDGLNGWPDSTGDSLPAGSAALYFVVGEAATRVIAQTPSGVTGHVAPLGRAALAGRVLALREGLSDPARDVLPQARALYDDLLRPVVDTLAEQDVKRLRLHLDDTLRYLPFAVLHDGDDFLVERFVLSRRHRGGAIAHDMDRAGRVAGFALTDAYSGFSALPAALPEVDAIVRVDAADDDGAYPGQVWSGGEFNRQSLIASLGGDFDRVHVASHFEFTPGNENDSFLLLGDGQKFSLYDLRTAQLSLGGTQLLTLSGCNTALLGDDADGREMDGFAQIALRQGARNIVATLWSVDDAATAGFMQDFYRRQAQGSDVAGALAATQAAFAQRHPYYWAPFVLWSQD
jgi:CHAT domain-containing protein/tetratricopeptide (TPR) repeat protein